MALSVENVFIDLATTDEATLVAQHQKIFPGNSLTHFQIGAATYAKVAYALGTAPAGLTVKEFLPLWWAEVSARRKAKVAANPQDAKAAADAAALDALIAQGTKP